MLFESWAGLGRNLVVGPLAYVALVAILRISGKRTLTQAERLRSCRHRSAWFHARHRAAEQSLSLADGVLALALLVMLQFAITWMSVRSPGFGSLVKSEPTLLAHQGQFLDRAIQTQRITRSEVMAALRFSGVADAARVAAVVLEPFPFTRNRLSSLGPTHFRR